MVPNLISDKKSLVSIILPSLNVADYIEETLKSVQDQSYANIEIICVDAMSTDGTEDIIKHHIENDKRIILITSNKKSYGYQVNVGIKSAHGEFVGIVETDDYVEKDYVENLIDYAIKFNCDYVKADHNEIIGNAIEGYEFHKKNVFYEGSVDYHHIFSKTKCDGIFMRDKYVWNGLYRKSFLEKNSILFNESKGAAYQDIGFLVQTVFASDRFGYINKPVYNYRVDREGSSINNKDSFFIEYEEINWILGNSFWKDAKDISKNEFRKRAAKDFFGSLICTLEKNNFNIDDKLERTWVKFSNIIKEWIDNRYICSLFYDSDTWDNILLAANNISEFNNKWKCIKKNMTEIIDINRENEVRVVGNKYIYDKVIFGTTNRRIIVFGAGEFFLQFMSIFRGIYHPDIILDNDIERQGEQVEEIPIESPSILLDMNPSEILIVICVKRYEEIVNQISLIGNFLYFIFKPKIE